MIDLHNHILPALDDGAQSLEESLAMARMAVDDGVEAVVCTPHWTPGIFLNGREAILSAVDELRRAISASGINLEVYPGSELRLEHDIPRRILEGEILTINDTGKYALIELPTEMVPMHIDQFFWELLNQDVTPILSHPERNYAFLQNPSRLFKLIDTGVLAQITAASLLGRFGSTIRNFSIMLLKHNMVHVLSTDAHGPSSRTPRLMEGFMEAERIVGSEAARALVYSTPKSIIEGKPLDLPPPRPLNKSGDSPSFMGKVFTRLGLDKYW